MIENIRKYRALIIFSLVLVAVALVIGMQSDTVGNSRGQRDLFRISGRSYSDVDFNHFGEGGYQLASTLAQSGDFDLYQFLMGLGAGATSQRDVPVKFFIARMVLRDAKEELGVYPAEEEILAYIQKMRFFAGTDQQFSKEKYLNFVQKSISHLGLTEADLRELVSDLLAYRKMNSIIGSGLAANREITARNTALNNQQASGNIARLDLDPFVAKIEPTEDEIKAYWEVIKDSFSTDPLRKFSYLIITPDLPKDEDADPKSDKPDSIVEAAATDEAKKKIAAEKTKKAADLAEKRRLAQLATDAKVDDFSFELDENEGKGFEELAKTNHWEIKTTELFPQSAPPKELDVKLRASSRGGKAVDELFTIEPTSDPLSSFSQPIAIGENQWLIARLDEKVDARIKTYEEARIQARDQYIQEKSAEAMKTAATEALEKIKTAITAGKTFAEAAKEAGITEIKEFSDVSSTTRPDAATEPKDLFAVSRNVDPGSFCELIVEADRVFIVQVTKREVVKEENAVVRIDTEVRSATNTNEMIAFSDWISSRIEAAGVEELFKQ